MIALAFPLFLLGGIALLLFTSARSGNARGPRCGSVGEPQRDNHSEVHPHA